MSKDVNMHYWQALWSASKLGLSVTYKVVEELWYSYCNLFPLIYISELCETVTYRDSYYISTYFTKITQDNLSAFVYKLFHDDFSRQMHNIICSSDWREIFMKQFADGLLIN